MDDKLTRKSQEALSAAIRKAASDGNPQVEPVHLLLELLKQAEGTAKPLLEAAGADMNTVVAEATALTRKLPQTRGATASAPETSRQLLAVINTAANLARELGDETSRPSTCLWAWRLATVPWPRRCSAPVPRRTRSPVRSPRCAAAPG
jgi:ATP-dependent Clp protease ATP-binding subunit ClpB